LILQKGTILTQSALVFSQKFFVRLDIDDGRQSRGSWKKGHSLKTPTVHNQPTKKKQTNVTKEIGQSFTPLNFTRGLVNRIFSLQTNPLL